MMHYETTETTEKTTPCAHEGCTCAGEFPAPRDARNPGVRQYFCAAHIKEFNARWDGLAGLSEDEIFHLQHGAATWNRPTWGLGLNGASAQAAQFTFATAEDLYAFFKARHANPETMDESRKNATGAAMLPPDVKEACAIFSLKKPVGGQVLKQRYITLVKKHHPDVNKNDPKAEQRVKKINVAYRILKDFRESAH